MPPKNAINDVVNSLMRAAAGSSAKNVADEDIDKYVADLILKEAQEKRKKYNEIGVAAYQQETKPKPKPNTRFLLNVVKATDSHNQAVIKANEENAARLRRERLQRERKRHASRSPSPRHERSRSRSYSPSRHEHSRSSRHKRSHSPSRHKRSRSPSQRKRSRSPSQRKHSHSKKKKRSKSPVKKSNHEIQYKGRGKIRIDVSSMDKYFSKGYDPVLDIESDEGESAADKKKKKKKKASSYRT